MHYDIEKEFNRTDLIKEAKESGKLMLRHIFDKYIYPIVNRDTFEHLAIKHKNRYISIIDTKDKQDFILRVKIPLKFKKGSRWISRRYVNQDDHIKANATTQDITLQGA